MHYFGIVKFSLLESKKLYFFKNIYAWAWWCTPLIPVLGRQRQVGGSLCVPGQLELLHRGAYVCFRAWLSRVLWQCRLRSLDPSLASGKLLFLSIFSLAPNSLGNCSLKSYGLHMELCIIWATITSAERTLALGSKPVNGTFTFSLVKSRALLKCSILFAKRWGTLEFWAPEYMEIKGLSRL